MWSIITDRMNLASRFGKQYSGDRDLYQALGYPVTIELEDYLARYDRQDIACAVIDKPVDATWRNGFDIMETDDDKETAFESAFDELDDRLKLVPIFSRLDIITMLGEYGVLLFGFDDVKQMRDFESPLNTGKRMLVYCKVFSQVNARIQEYENDPTNERFGLPKIYQLTTMAADNQSSIVFNVHYSRVLHVISKNMESEVAGTPEMKKVFNRLMDIEKIVGGSAEMYWRGARPGYQGKVDPEFSMGTEAKEALRAQVDEYEHNLRRIMVNEGVSLESLAQQLADPSNYLDAQIQLISAATGIPKRILTGSERGELSSTTDRDTWADVITTRRTVYAEGQIIRPFVDKMILHSVLPPPGKDGYTVVWQSLYEATEKEKVDVGNIRAQALNSYAASPASETIVPPAAFFEFFLGFDKEQIDLITEMQDAAVKEEEANAPNPDEEKQLMEDQKERTSEPTVQGGGGSGNFGHAGRTGKVGGSSKSWGQMSKEEKKQVLEENALVKWSRCSSFAKDHSSIMDKINSDFDSRDEAKVLYLINKTGFRVGGQRVRGEKEVYGASTLLPEHVKVTGNTLEFNFLGKKAVDQSHDIADTKLANMFKECLTSGKSPIFDTDDGKIRAYLKEVSGKNYLVKDFRTYVATSTVAHLVASYPKPSSEKQYKKAVNDVCKVVSSILGNTPGMAKNSYIDPVVWEGLK